LTGRAVLAGFRQLDPALEEAAASLGAGRWAAFRRVTLPLLRPALAAGASLAFVAALGDFVTAIVLYTYDNRPISIEIMSSLRLSELGVAAAGHDYRLGSVRLRVPDLRVCEHAVAPLRVPHSPGTRWRDHRSRSGVRGGHDGARRTGEGTGVAVSGHECGRGHRADHGLGR